MRVAVTAVCGMKQERARKSWSCQKRKTHKHLFKNNTAHREAMKKTKQGL